jgi:TonB-linked SusC/RagA family outer membrane protein
MGAGREPDPQHSLKQHSLKKDAEDDRMTRGTTWLLTAAVGLAPSALVAQATTGTITGRVVDRETRQPLVAVQVFVSPTRGATTNEAGEYRITGVPAGTVTVRTRRIGFAAASQTATVAAGGTAVVNLDIARSASQLEQVVVSATGVTQRRREVGAATSNIDTTAYNVANVRNLGQVLAARTPGVIVQAPGGTAGTGARIRLRGVASLSLSNDPLLVIDGVIANNATSNLTIGVGGQQVSRFEDINPEEIENIEVLKGPAATAQFGTGAANGVIQITTKRGRAGRPVWNAWGEGGREVTPVPLNDPLQTVNYRQIGRNANGTRNGGCSIEQQALRNCVTPDTLYTNSPFANASPFRTGGNATGGLSVSGGSNDFQFFLSGEHDRINGITQPNFLNRTNLRSNVTANLRPNLNTNVSIGYIQSANGLPINDNAFAGFMSAGLLGIAFDCNQQTIQTVAECGPNARNDSTSRGYVSTNVPVTQYFAQRQQQDLSRLTIGTTTNYNPKSWLRATVRGGADLTNRYTQTLTPPNRVFLNAASIEGSRFQERSFQPNYNLQLSLIGTASPLPWLRSSTTVGGQYLDERNARTDAFGAVLLPGVSSLTGTSARFSVSEINSRIRTVAGYVEQRFEARDRLFFTLGLRADESSVFGSDFALVYYPSANVSWVLSEEPFFHKPDWIGTMRLRAAYGRAGQRPGFRQAFTTFSAVSVNASTPEGSIPAAVFNSTGNAGLRPEISGEFEGGIESTFLGERVRVELTGYQRNTQDLLVARNLAPSLGVSATQFVNLSQMRTSGFEGAVTATLLRRTNFSFDQTVNLTTFRNQIDELGSAGGQEIAPIPLNNARQFFRAGYPAGGYFQRRILSYGDLNGDGLISRINCPSYGGVANPQQTGGPRCEVVLSDSLEYLGSPLPTREVSFLSNATLFKNFTLTALVNYRAGQKLWNQTREFRNNGGFANGPDFWDRRAPLEDQVKAVARGMGSSAGYIENANFVRLSELSLTAAVPERVARLARVRGLALTVAGRNLGVWSPYTGFDPEVNSNNGANFTTFDFLTNPPTRRLTARITATF